MRQFDRLAAALLTLGLMMSAAQAADYGADPLVDAPSLIPPEEIGTGWYLRGDIGYMRNTASGSWRQDQFTKEQASNGYSGQIGFGYKYNEWLRADLTAERIDKFDMRSSAPCRNLGCLPGDRSQERAQLSAWTLMANGYIDFGNWGGVTPYVGAGLGAARVSVAGSQSFNPGDMIADDRFATGERWSIAASGMAGASYDLGRGLQIDAGYRYLWIAGGISGASSNVNQKIEYKDISSHQVRVGLRYFVY